MPSEKERIVLRRYEDMIVVEFEHAYEDRSGFIMYRTGELESEDVENSYIGALKYFFDNSEVWDD